MTFRSLMMLSAVLALGACGDDGGDDDAPAEETPPDECPTELTYDAVAAPFLENWCESCHSPTAASKLGAGNVIDSETRIREHGKGLYDLVLSGEMPKAGGPVPEAEKKNFLDWMECSGAAAGGHNHSH
jgi:cytochrome c5